MKLCKDCKYLGGGLGLLCKSPHNGISLIDGEANPMWASQQRTESIREKRCGPNAVYFEPKIEINKNRAWWKLW